MTKSIAIIASLDTKGEDVLFLNNLIREQGHRTFIIDTGSKKQSLIKPDIDIVKIAKEVGVEWSFPVKTTRKEYVDVLKKGVARMVPGLYRNGKFDAVISIGGLQNTTIAVSAMKTLPLGVPKVMVSTMASGKRPFDLIVGYSDIIPFPSLADFSGRNIVTDTVLSNAVAAIIGMVENAGKPLIVTGEMLVGITAMGVVNRAAEGVITELKKKGYSVVSFHSTGVGGKIMDGLIEEGIVRAAVELSLHEIVGELFGGYSSGADGRLVVSCEKGIPQVIVPGGCDFIDLEAAGLEKNWFKRKHIYHNSDIIHFKLTEEEILEVAKLIVSRLNKSKGPVTIIIPLKGFREGTKEGEPMYAPEVDRVLIETIREETREDIKIIEVDANINDDEFIDTVSIEAERIIDLT